MKIAFDMDGVLRTIDLGLLKQCEKDGDFEPMVLSTSMAPLLLNPFLFTLPEEDDIFVISSCPSKTSEKMKEEWVRHFLGIGTHFLPIRIKGGWGKSYCEPTAKAKIEIMLSLDIEVYFEDDPSIVKLMRSMTDKIKIIHYGTWITEYNPPVKK